MIVFLTVLLVWFYLAGLMATFAFEQEHARIDGEGLSIEGWFAVALWPAVWTLAFVSVVLMRISRR